MTPLSFNPFKQCTGANQEEIMICERCRGLKLLDRFYGMANDGSVWMYDGLRCVNCGSVTGFQMGERAVNDAPRGAERANRYPLRVQAVTG